MTESSSDRLFRDRDLSGARFVGCDLTSAVIRGSDIGEMELDSPWLFEAEARLLVNGVDVAPFVDGELNRRFPGRELRVATSTAGLRQAWTALEHAWAGAVARAEGLPAGSLDISVHGEWSFAQTVRHLVMATDTWLGLAILHLPSPYHPAGLPNDDGDSAAYDASVFSSSDPTWAEVLHARADRQQMVRDYLATLDDEVLDEHRANPHNPAYDKTVLSCLRTILEEEWEHLRYATRDLGIIEQASSAS